MFTTSCFGDGSRALHAVLQAPCVPPPKSGTSCCPPSTLRPAAEVGHFMLSSKHLASRRRSRALHAVHQAPCVPPPKSGTSCCPPSTLRPAAEVGHFMLSTKHLASRRRSRALHAVHQAPCVPPLMLVKGALMSDNLYAFRGM